IRLNRHELDDSLCKVSLQIRLFSLELSLDFSDI
ncbi:unnamed protein product, partial [marine sediment metagenome]